MTRTTNAHRSAATEAEDIATAATRKAANKARAKTTVIDNDTQHVEEDVKQADSAFRDSFAAYQEALNPIKEFTRRAIVAFVASLATYAVGITTGCYIAVWLSNAVLWATSWMWLAAVVEIFVVLLAVAASMLAGAFVARWISTGQAIEDFDAAKNWVKRKFESSSSYLKARMARAH